MASKFYEFIHVSEMLETMLALSIPLLLISQFLMLRNQLWADISRLKTQTYSQQEKWHQEQRAKLNTEEEAPPQNKLQESAARDIKEELAPEVTPRQEEPTIRKSDMTSQQPSKPPQQPLAEAQNMDTAERELLEGSKRQSLRLFLQINEVFDRNLPVIMCCVVLAMMVAGTYILTAICFFCYIFFNLMFNYAKLVEKLEMKIENRSVPLILTLVADIFIVVFFIGVLVRSEFQP